MGREFSSEPTAFHVWGPNRGAQYSFGNDKEILYFDERPNPRGIKYSTDNNGWKTNFVQKIGQWSSSFENRDTLFIMGSGREKNAKAIKNTSGEMRSTADYGLPELYVNSYVIHKNDEPIVGTGDVYHDIDNKEGSFNYDDYKNYDKVSYYNESFQGIACPGSSRRGFATGGKIRCVYNDSEIKSFSGIKNQFASSPKRMDLYNTILKKYCDIGGNENKQIADDKKCFNVLEDAAQKSYCSAENRLSTDSLCSKSSLGNSYAIISEEYCKANPTADFCACYNVTKNLCTEQPDLPGCKIVQPIWDTIKETLEEGDIAQFEGMQPCYGSVCTGNVYKPDKWDANCNKNISICKANFSIGGDLVGSNISVKQDCGNTTNEGGGSGGGSGSGSSETTTTNNDDDDDDDDDDEEKTLIEKIFKLKEDKDKKFIEKRVVKVGGGILSLIFCLLCIITLIMFA